MTAPGEMHPDGEIIEARADEDGVIHVESYVNNEPVTRLIEPDHDGNYHPATDTTASPALHYDGEIVAARLDSDGTVHVDQYGSGEILHRGFAEERYTQGEEARYTRSDVEPIVHGNHQEQPAADAPAAHDVLSSDPWFAHHDPAADQGGTHATGEDAST